MKERLFKSRPNFMYVGRTKREYTSSSEDATDILFFARGGIKVALGNETLKPSSGDLLVIDASLPYETDLGNSPVGTVTFLSVSGGRLYNNEGLYGESGCRLLSSGEQRGIMETTLRQILREKEAKSAVSDILISSLTETFLTLTARLLPYEPIPRKTSQIFEVAKKYFDEHYLEDETIVEACAKLGVDRYRLTHIFSQEMGIPPIKYLITKRMSLAKQLLETTDADINCVAKECGYPDATYFCRIFKQTQGKTALSYRAECKQSKALYGSETAATLSAFSKK